ncbi:MAG: hypothetical protein FJ039_02625 [Chloroflexi bacterium]|nr:hypothetical protein [Chloroflexota bacterium]
MTTKERTNMRRAKGIRGSDAEAARAGEEIVALRGCLQRLLDKYVETLEWNSQGYIVVPERLPEVMEAKELLQRGGK